MAIREELRSACFWRAVLAEALATLIFVGVVLGASATPGPLAPALAGGLAAAALPHTLGAPQANPALTLALLCTRKLSALRGAAGLLAQCTGAVLASAAARSALPDDASLVTRVSVPPVPVPIPVPIPVPAGAEAWLWLQVSAAGTVGQAWGWETFATFQLALAAFATANNRAAGPTGLALGSAVAAGALAAGPFSGGSMNPARSLGPAIVTGIWDDHWVYWLGPVPGAVLAAFSYEFVFAPGASREKLGACLACRDVAPVEATSPTPSSPSTAPPRGPPPTQQGQDAA
ncbi:lens fiber major intrinsic protein-like [Aythya fuligula]|uniref:Lens fiber major intrinsic protein-like n=1 Tax=Aythya fuligula TaxID=219594 RepID=A0A6J3EH01_AYTFU|nr:lens fiber major intrinsic protein-like [Aythya fuligula]